MHSDHTWQDIFNDYNPHDFGKRTETWGFALIRFQESNGALAAANDMDGYVVEDNSLKVLT